jgi:hypothetical protein
VLQGTRQLREHLYTIHGYKNSQDIPLVFALLTNKSSAVEIHFRKMWGV